MFKILEALIEPNDIIKQEFCQLKDNSSCFGIEKTAFIEKEDKIIKLFRDEENYAQSHKSKVKVEKLLKQKSRKFTDDEISFMTSPEEQSNVKGMIQRDQASYFSNKLRKRVH